MVANTGWTWDEAGRLTIPRLKALNRHWAKHPPVHLLVAAYLDFKPPIDLADEPARQSDEPDANPAAFARMAGVSALQPSDALRTATDSTEALAALERMCFGTLMEI